MDGETRLKLESARNLWVTTVRPDGRPHLTPVWFVLSGDRLVICISSHSVKARNLRSNPAVAASLEDGAHPVILEGSAQFLPVPWPEEVLRRFRLKYDWDIRSDPDYNLMIEIRPSKWLKWN